MAKESGGSLRKVRKASKAERRLLRQDFGRLSEGGTLREEDEGRIKAFTDKMTDEELRKRVRRMRRNRK
jgi:hypothetical protein